MRMAKNPSLTALRRRPSHARPASAVASTDSHGSDGEHLRSDKASLRSCNDTLRSLLRSAVRRHRAEALSVLRGMLAPDSSCRPDSNTCAIVFSSWSKQSLPLDNEALGLLVQMANMGFFPTDAFHFTQLVNKLCRSGATSAAWDFLHAVKDAGGAVETPACNALLTGLATARDFARMNLLFSEMKGMGVRPNVANEK
ncbi:hypothetical protein OPV22_017636 [Ensete ventricosum]|uniref:Pentacotripeptide-repeat region of PRORP domain-containing protein n=1 Tax=Ensete ventricosum TaxID=4639 RepID=A0AAV8PHY6_ENSVE|nr:hypothetical protein OPV22_017636 [Ensete ventricosum]